MLSRYDPHKPNTHHPKQHTPRSSTQRRDTALGKSSRITLSIKTGSKSLTEMAYGDPKLESSSSVLSFQPKQIFLPSNPSASNALPNSSHLISPSLLPLHPLQTPHPIAEPLLHPVIGVSNLGRLSGDWHYLSRGIDVIVPGERSRGNGIMYRSRKHRWCDIHAISAHIEYANGPAVESIWRITRKSLKGLD